MDYFAQVLRVIKRAKTFGFRTLSNGTRLYGRVPHVGPEAWLHSVFPPLTSKQMIDVETRIRNKLPLVLRDFLGKTNGLKLFSFTFAIEGLRENYVRQSDAAWQQPYSIETHNTRERLADSQPSFIFFGFYDSDGSLLYMDSTNEKVYRCSARSSKPLNEWPDFWEMLVNEATRLQTLFDDMGRKLDEDAPTTPPDDR